MSGLIFGNDPVELDWIAENFCSCGHPLIKCDDKGCRCTSCERPEWSGNSIYKVGDQLFIQRRTLPDNSYEESIVAANSTPGLKKNQLTYAAKKEHLNSQGMSKYPEDRDKLLAQIYSGELR
jgi:hypothetical protein